jgi:peptide deformylase
MELLTYPNKTLRSPCQLVESVTPQIRADLSLMMEKMDAWDGIGLAAPQCGISLRMFVMHLPGEGRYAFINPEIEILNDDTSSMEEGCLSLPGALILVTRPATVKIKALNYNGKVVNHIYTGIASACVQHETDHLSGILIIDKVESYSRRRALQNVWDHEHPTKG